LTTSPLDAQIFLDILLNMPDEMGWKKPEILPLVNASSEASIFQNNNSDIILKSIATKSRGKKCYNLGFMEHCE